MSRERNTEIQRRGFLRWRRSPPARSTRTRGRRLAAKMQNPAKKEDSKDPKSRDPPLLQDPARRPSPVPGTGCSGHPGCKASAGPLRGGLPRVAFLSRPPADSACHMPARAHAAALRLRARVRSSARRVQDRAGDADQDFCSQQRRFSALHTSLGLVQEPARWRIRTDWAGSQRAASPLRGAGQEWPVRVPGPVHHRPYGI